MKAIIIYSDNCIIEGGIYEGISEKKALEEVGEGNLYYYIPLTVPGNTYNARKNNLRDKAIEYQYACSDFEGFSWGELATIQRFFETNGKKYGLLTEFHENCIC